ncbi:MAG: LeoA/HP0731 family dynamin-like GTPase [candidate division WOR-3 bacterium]|nr:50S ribosome-binding GTPase [Candidatus Omnitrophota bacterium]
MIKDFSQKKKEILEKLNELKEKLVSISENWGVDVSEIKLKIERSIENIRKECFSIAFFGAFSDGKSTIISFLTKRLDIKIAPEPTTEEIKSYPFGDFLLIDTPGLFSEYLMYEERTKKYISEANVILYILDAVNPLKKSHYPVVKWLLIDLDKIDSTIFVLNKMDNVADLEDKNDYQQKCVVKKKVVEDTLKEVVGEKLKDKPKIICIAADPGGKGLEFWFNNKKEYEKLSRIQNLWEELEKFVKLAKNKLIIKAGISVIKESVDSTIKNLEKEKKGIEKELEISENQIKEISNRLETFKKDIIRNYSYIKEEVLNLREGMLSLLESCVNLEDLKNFIIKQVGEEGNIINEKINLIIQKYTQSLSEENYKLMVDDIQNVLDFHKEVYENLVKKLGSRLALALRTIPTKNLANSILKIRDMLKMPIKFKPWGAIKFAGKLQKVALFLGAILEIKEILDEIKFKKEKEKVANQIEDLFNTFIESFTLEEYQKTYFSDILEWKNLLNNLEKDKEIIAQTLERIKNTIKDLENFVLFIDNLFIEK